MRIQPLNNKHQIVPHGLISSPYSSYDKSIFYQLWQSGKISTKSVLEKLDIDYEKEVEKIYEEFSSNQVASLTAEDLQAAFKIIEANGK